MKVCPTCDEVYQDDQINFCLSDGTTLLKKKSSKPRKHSHWNDVLAIILAAVAVLVFLCLITNSADIPSLKLSGGGLVKTENWTGVVGSNIAAVLFSTFGWTAYLIPFLIGLIGWQIYKSDTLLPRASRVLGFVFFTVSLSGLMTLFGGYGAIVGEAAAHGTAYFIGSIGAGILLGAMLVSSLLLVTNFTLEGAVGLFGLAGENFLMQWNEWWDKNRTIQKEAAHIRAEKRKGKREPFPGLAANPTTSRSELLFDEVAPLTPTIDTRKNPYETLKGEPEFAEISIDLPAKKPEDYRLPSTTLLTGAPLGLSHNENQLRDVGRLLEQKTRAFNVPGKVMHIAPGPVVTTFEFELEEGIKYSRVTGLVDDLCLALKVPSIRIDRIPGKAYVGIEVPNQKRETIYLREVIESAKFTDSDSLLTLGLGKTIDGGKYLADLEKMPHLLIAGTTGSGKSVGINSIVMSLLFKGRPDEIKFIMIDPKGLELGPYADIPHLSTPIITDPKRAATALQWAVSEMGKRYKDLAQLGVKNLADYNKKVVNWIAEGRPDDNGDPYCKLPYIVIIIDEFADLMMVSGKEVESLITRLAQMSRAVGIHLVLATQRPSSEVVTGLIKANLPSRISFRLPSRVDSRSILDTKGAENLLGNGDMLLKLPGHDDLVRVHGAFVNDGEIAKVIDFIKAQGRPEYDSTIIRNGAELDDGGDLPGRRDPLFMDALKCVVQAKRGSTSLLQRHLRIGYGRAAALLDAMVREGYIGEMDGSTRNRPTLPKAYEDLFDVEQGSDS